MRRNDTCKHGAMLTEPCDDCAVVPMTTPPPDTKVQSETTVRHIRINTMTWPTIDSDLAWRLRYAQDSISNTDKFYLASLMDAYSELIRCKREKREMVCRAIREGR